MALVRRTPYWLGTDGKLHSPLGDVLTPPPPPAAGNPNARITVNSIKLRTVVFSGALSTEGTTQVALTSFTWNFGDGSVGVGSAQTHAYAADGTYQVTLTVADQLGATDTDTFTVSVVGTTLLPPVASFVHSESFLALSVDASASSDPQSGVLSYAWTFGDGGAASGVQASHTYASPGSYKITLALTDDSGLTSTATATVTVVAQPVTPVPPTARFSLSVSTLSVALDASSSDNGSASISSYAWDFGDGFTGTGQLVSHTYAAAGSYQVQLTVTTSVGANSLFQQVTVASAPPPPPGWTLNWTEDFLGTAVDSGTWTVDNGTTYGSGNNELQLCMAKNVSVANSLFSGTGLKETLTVGGVTRNYTSFHLSSKGKREFTVGPTQPLRVEVRAQLPDTRHLLLCPLWLRPSDGVSGGEIDLMEAAASTDTDDPNNVRVIQTVHTSYSPSLHTGGNTTVDPAHGFTGSNGVRDWHVYAIEFYADHIQFFVDGKPTVRVDSSSSQMSSTPTFATTFGSDRSWFFHITMGIGGNLPGTPTAANIWPAVMNIDWIKVYR